MWYKKLKLGWAWGLKERKASRNNVHWLPGQDPEVKASCLTLLGSQVNQKGVGSKGGIGKYKPMETANSSANELRWPLSWETPSVIPMKSVCLASRPWMGAWVRGLFPVCYFPTSQSLLHTALTCTTLSRISLSLIWSVSRGNSLSLKWGITNGVSLVYYDTSSQKRQLQKQSQLSDRQWRLISR